MAATRVLIVDDKEAARESLQLALDGFDCVFYEASSGLTALRFIREQPFDVILLDLKLPDINGIEVLREAVKSPSGLGKVIVMTALPDERTKAEAASLGAAGYLVKLDYDELRSTFAAATSSISRLPEPTRDLGTDLRSNVLASSVQTSGTQLSDSRPRLLVLDDSELWLETMHDLLGNDFDLTLTASVDEAYVRTRTEYFALVVVDVKLAGGVSGLDVLTRMRRTTPNLRAIILAGHPDYTSAMESGRRGAVAYVSKSNLSGLADTVNRIISNESVPISVFLSYDVSDRPAVSRLYEQLTARGFLPWMDVESILPGQRWEQEIRAAIDKAHFFVLCLSTHTDLRRVTRYELKYALERQRSLLGDSIFLITARLDDCQVVEPLNQFQFVDLFRPDGFSKLVSALSSERGAGLSYRPELNAVLPVIRRFLASACQSVTQKGPAAFDVRTSIHRLAPYEPLSLYVTIDPTTSADVDQIAASATAEQADRVGILIYQQRPDALAQIRIAQRRLEDRFWLIPIPLPELDRAVREEASTALLSEYADRYLPGADLFGDKNAIGDTLAFFGRSDLLKRLKDELLRVQGVGLFGIRKSGKTSVLLQLPHVIPENPVAHIDLQTFSSTRFAVDIFNQILRKLATYVPFTTVASIPQDLPLSHACQQFTELLQAVAGSLSRAGLKLPMLCFLDEVERIMPQTDGDVLQEIEFNAFFGTLRAVSQQYRILSILVADTHPDCNRINRWSFSVATNPVFSFFKEVYLRPFTRAETDEMIEDIGRLMSRHFDTATLSSIHGLSGGHPFLSRQLASLLCAKISAAADGHIDFVEAQKYLVRAMHFSSFLKLFVGGSIWDDNRHRGGEAHLNILRLLACQDDSSDLSEERFLAALAAMHPTGNVIDACGELEELGLVGRVSSPDGDSLRLSMGLLRDWIRIGMRKEEIAKWRTL
jgi:CheY-like chemotaxis protein